MTGKFEALCTEIPATTTGFALDIHGPLPTDEWRWVVQIALPSPTAGIWGIGKWGEAKWSGGLEWFDITDRWRGCQVDRGIESITSRYRVATASIEFANADHKLSSWNNGTFLLGSAANYLQGWLVPGTLIRCGLVFNGTPRAWYPLFTGISEQWTESSSEMDADPRMVVTAIDTMSYLAGIDGVEKGAVGAGEDQVARINRLLDEAEWPFPRDLEASPSRALQATTLAANRLTECYLTADSVGYLFYAGRDGSAMLVEDTFDPPAVAPSYVLGERARTRGEFSDGVRLVWDFDAEIPYQPAPEFNLDKATVRNQIALAAAGGTVVEKESSTSRAKYGPRRFSRFDLICQSGELVHTLAADKLQRLRWPWWTVSATVNLNGASTFEVLRLFAMYDIRNKLMVWRNGPAGVLGKNRIVYATEIAAMSHRVTPIRSGLLDWSCQYTLVNGGAQSSLAGGNIFPTDDD